MQGFIDKVSESKGKLLVGLGGAAVIGLFGYLYRQYKNQTAEQQISQQDSSSTQPFNIRNELAKFKQRINLTNPTLEQVKEIIAFSFDMTYKQIERVHNDFKLSRRLLKDQGTLKDYFKTVGAGMIRLRQIGTTLQQAIMIDIGATPELFAPYQYELTEFVHEQQMKRSLGNKDVSLGEVKAAINTQVDFLKEHGDQLVSNIITYCKDWQAQAKQFIPDVFTIYLADQLSVQHPEMDKYDMRGAEKKFENYLINETAMMKQQIQPKIARLIKELGMYPNQAEQ